MVIYWRRPLDGQGQIGERCPLIEEATLGRVEDRPLAFVSAHFCLLCPYRGKECKRPIWFPEVGGLDEKANLKEEIYARLKGVKK
ncbi:hypothetical protein [Ignicoccus hospitalis]|uniref:hypothetical protein n=1 Tax=Ignicoccus hospitalis TaxID=160233 RepID=UPI000698A47A|nr:hypothetical protein [Ignicoccus hospitalis]HIH90307.1 hypothetical protein [Desulfurococcaceae archaeon]